MNPPTGAPGRRVLVVDDNVDSAVALLMLLQVFGHSVEIAHDAESGLAAAVRTRPDVIFCDAKLPRITGYQFAGSVRANPDLSKARLVCLTGYNRDDVRRRALQSGFDEVYTKPLAAEELARIVDANSN